MEQLRDLDADLPANFVLSQPTVAHPVSPFGALAERLSQTAAGQSSTDPVEDRLVDMRLGIATSLFLGLRYKHPPTAAHSLRVALGCSAWSFALELNPTLMRHIEVAALLHDIGKLAVPDAILLKPGKLAPDEMMLMEKHRRAGHKILRSCCSSNEILDIVRHLPSWYDGSTPDCPLVGREIPFGARMLAIVDAYDSMTTDSVYRSALSRDKALSELFAFSGTQFDPKLLELFSEMQLSDDLSNRVVSHWLEVLKPADSSDLWHHVSPESMAVLPPDSLFTEKLLDNMNDAVVFVDRDEKIIQWNRGAERLTGISAAAVCQQAWVPSLINLRDEKGTPIEAADCPVHSAIHTGVQCLRRFLIRGRQARQVAVDFHVVPVTTSEGMTYGAALLLHDASPEASLEKRCQSLHERATKDPLTQVANRAEFDRTHKMFVAAHLERRLPCSLIICDVDHFKQVNDTFGHQAGDEALKCFAQLLKSSCRPGDLVARYGGEEFVVLCADCNVTAATNRAEQMRQTLSSLNQAALSGKPMTASFGVTEVESGDTAASMLRRADRALLQAKQGGRNRVVQIGAGIGEEEPSASTSWFARRPSPPRLLEMSLVTAVPLKMALEKVRGFVGDHHAQIRSIDADQVCLEIDMGRSGLVKRGSDRPMSFLIELRFKEQRGQPTGTTSGPGRVCQTKLDVVIRPLRQRDRRRKNLGEAARQVATSLKSYLMAVEETTVESEEVSAPARGFFPWFRKR